MLIKRLKMKGITCFNDEVDIDFSQYPNGLICLAGGNGSGKTSLIEAMAPAALFREFPSRQDRRGLGAVATGSNSALEVEFEYADQEYVVRHQMDPEFSNGRGKSEAFLFLKDTTGNLKPLTNGRLSDFDELIKTHFFDQDILYASAFSVQTGYGTFSSLSRRDRRSLFVRMLGLNKLQKIAQIAKSKAANLAKLYAHDKEMEALALEKQTRAEKIRQSKSKIEQAQQSLNDSLQGARERLANLKYELKRSEEQLQQGVIKANKYNAEHRFILDQIVELKAELKAESASRPEGMFDLEQKKVALEQQISFYEDKKKQAWEQHRAQSDELSRFNTELSQVTNNIEQAKKEKELLEGLFSKAQKGEELSTDLEFLALYKHTTTLEIEVDHSRSQLSNLRFAPCKGKLLYRRTNEGDTPVICGECGFYEEAQKAEALMKTAQKALIDANNQVRAFIKSDNTLSDASKRLTMMQEQLTTYEVQINTLGRKAKSLNNDVTGAKLVLAMIEQQQSKAERALKKLFGEREELSKLTAKSGAKDVGALAKKLSVLEGALSEVELLIKGLGVGALEKSREVASEKVDAAEQTVESFLEASRQNDLDLARLGGVLSELGDVSGNLAAIREQLAETSRKKEGYSLLAKSAGPDGVQALEIDSAMPEVSESASSILEAIGGPIFAIELRSQRLQVSGKKNIEVFDIMAHARDGHCLSFEKLSVGEQVLVDEALKLAISIFNARRNPLIKTLWRDECDGALQEDLRATYPAMLREAMRVGGFERCFFISHDKAVQSQADAIITLERGRILQPDS